MDTITFKVKSTAVTTSLFVARRDAPATGSFVPLQPDSVGLAGSIDLPPGTYTYTLVLTGGQPGSPWGMTIQRNTNPAVPRAGKLDGAGNDGDFGVFTVV